MQHWAKRLDEYPALSVFLWPNGTSKKRQKLRIDSISGICVAEISLLIGFCWPILGRPCCRTEKTESHT
jgi:hypothetical protein